MREQTPQPFNSYLLHLNINIILQFRYLERIYQTFLTHRLPIFGEGINGPITKHFAEATTATFTIIVAPQTKHKSRTYLLPLPGSRESMSQSFLI
jgi:hypothetical protein